METPQILEGFIHEDERGELFAFPNFSLLPIVRMYAIRPLNTEIIRAWQGHRFERKWFWPSKGSFEIKLLPFDENGKPSSNQRMNFILNARMPKLLLIPGGYINGFKALERDSMLLVFSDFNLEDSINDDIRFGLDDIKWTTI